MFLYDEPPCDECLHCMEKENRLEDVKYWFQPVLDQLYGFEAYCPTDLIRYLNELTILLGMKLPKETLGIMQRGHSHDFVERWVEFNTQYLNNLKTGT